MKLFFGAIVIAAASRSLDAQAATRPDSVAAVAVVDRFHAALAAADSAKAVSLLADDVLIIEAGHIQTRAEYLVGHLGADMKASQSSRGERTVVKVNVTPAAAYVVTKTLTPPTGAQGNTGSEMAELMIVAKTSSGWRISAVHWSSRRRRP